MNADELREQGERLSRELGRESYRAGAGLASDTDFAGIFARHAAVAGDEAWEAAEGSRMLREWVADMRIGRAVADLDDRLHAWEARAMVALPGGEVLPYQKVGIEISNEPDRERRLVLDRARRSVLGEPAALRAERLEREGELLQNLTGRSYVEARSELSGIDLDALGRQCAEFLAVTADLYRDVLRERLRDIGVHPDEAERSDGAYLTRASGYDEWFSGPDLVAVARRQMAELGLDLEASGRIVLDVEERERKRARAFCCPVRVPEEVYVVIRPHGGYPDYRAFWHELGHALHFGNTSPSLPFEARWVGDNSVTEGYAMLFEYQLIQPAWLRRYARLSGERLRAFLRLQAFALLAMVRRYAAKLGYELALHRAASLAAGAAEYAPGLTEATGFRYAPEDALLDLDDGFYAARYLRAWQYEATLRALLVERFDEDWFRNPRAAPFLLDLFARGQREDASQLARELTGSALEFAPLVRACEMALQ